MTTKNAIEAAIPMIKNLKIRNFKSIKNLDLECERINLFIGEPNTGKSNILETLSILSFSKYGPITDFVRIESMSDLFYEENIDERITISADDTVLEITFDKERFIGRCYKKELTENALFSFDFDYNGCGNVNYGDTAIPIKFYKFSPLKEFDKRMQSFFALLLGKIYILCSGPIRTPGRKL